NHDAVLPEHASGAEHVAAAHGEQPWCVAGDVCAADEPDLAALLLRAQVVRGVKQHRYARIGEGRGLRPGSHRIAARIGEQKMKSKVMPSVPMSIRFSRWNSTSSRSSRFTRTRPSCSPRPRSKYRCRVVRGSCATRSNG